MFDMTESAISAQHHDCHKKNNGATRDGARNMTGAHKRWQSLLRSECAGNDPFWAVHCGPHRLNLINNRSIKALGATESELLAILHKLVKWLRKEVILSTA